MPSLSTSCSFLPEPTADGSFTFISATFGEAFHNRHGARQEAEQKFAVPTQLAAKAQTGSLRLLDICYGLGYNTASALETIWRVNPACRVEVVALELEPEVPQAAIAHQLLQPWPDPIPDCLATLAQTGRVEGDRLKGHLIWGDARRSLLALDPRDFQADAIFLDPFSPPRCPQLWTVEFLALVARFLHPQGHLATYSCAAAVRTALQATGLQIGASPPFGRRWPGTIAGWSSAELPPLSAQEQEHLQTRAAVPYRDPRLQDDAETIHQRRLQEQSESLLEATSRWRKRWAMIEDINGDRPSEARISP